MNEPVREMIKKLHARLDDLETVVGDVPFELNGYDKKLDRIDDQIYLIEVELEKKLKNTVPIAPVSDAQSQAFDAAAGREQGSKTQADQGNGSKTQNEQASSGKIQNGQTADAQGEVDVVHIVDGSDRSAGSKVTIEPESPNGASHVKAQTQAQVQTEVSFGTVKAEGPAQDSRVEGSVQAPQAENDATASTSPDAPNAKPTLQEEGFFTDSAKETIAGATKKLNSFYKEGKEVVGEFSEALGDIKEVFGKNPFKKR